MGISSSSRVVEPKPRKDIVLPVRPRYQWPAPQRNGRVTKPTYCSECCVQTAALYYGCYVSQGVVRQLANLSFDEDPKELWKLDSLEFNPNKASVDGSEGFSTVLDKLDLTYEFWEGDPTLERKQFNKVACVSTPGFLGWTKRHIFNAHPVIMGVYQPNGREDSAYDHTILATGIRTQNGLKNKTDYTDVLLFVDGSGERDGDIYQERSVINLTDNRRMTQNGFNYGYCIPDDRRNYGVAITGTNSQSEGEIAVRIEVVGNNDEPNYGLHMKEKLNYCYEAPIQLELIVTVSDLQLGDKYALYKTLYTPDKDEENKVDAENTNKQSQQYTTLITDVRKIQGAFEREGDKPFKVFVVYKNECRSKIQKNGAVKFTYTIVDTVRSDAFVCYRCLHITPM